MKRTLIKSLLLAAAVTVLASCFPDMEYLYTDTSMCTYVSGNTLKTDAGEIYHITSNNSGANMPDTLIFFKHSQHPHYPSSPSFSEAS